MCLRIYAILLGIYFVTNFTDPVSAQKKELNFSCNYDPQNLNSPFPVEVRSDSLSLYVRLAVDTKFLASVEFNDVKDTLAEFHCKFSIWDINQDKQVESETLLVQMGFESGYYQDIKIEHQIDSSDCLLVEIAGVNSAYEFMNILSYNDLVANRKISDFRNNHNAFDLSEPKLLLETVQRLLRDKKVDSLLETTGDPKIALDLFWYKAANADLPLAKEAIRVFYNRVRTAQFVFGNDPRSDIYILLGLPDFVKKKDGAEVWRYSSFRNTELVFLQENGRIIFDTTPESKALIKRAVRSWCNAHPVVE